MTIARTEKIIADLTDRGVEIGAVLAINMKTNKLIFITYDANGIVSDISQEEKAVTIYGKNNAETRAMHEIITLEANNPKTPGENDG